MLFKKARTKKDILNHPAMGKVNGRTDFWTEPSDDTRSGYSYWGYVKAGFQVYGNEQHTIHEPTIESFCDVLNQVEEWKDDPELLD